MNVNLIFEEAPVHNSITLQHVSRKYFYTKMQCGFLYLPNWTSIFLKSIVDVNTSAYSNISLCTVY